MFDQSLIDKFCIGKEVKGLLRIYVVSATIEMYNILIKKTYYLCKTFSSSSREKTIAYKTCYRNFMYDKTSDQVSWNIVLAVKMKLANFLKSRYNNLLLFWSHYYEEIPSCYKEHDDITVPSTLSILRWQWSFVFFGSGDF